MESREQMEEAAAAWIFKRDAGEWTSDDELALAAWLESSTAHRIVYLRLHGAWQNAARLTAVGAGIPSGRLPAAGEQHPARGFFRRKRPPGLHAGAADWSRRGRAFRSALAVAALVATLAVAVTYLVPHGPMYRTAVGGLEAVPIRDGSKVTLNTDSAIRIALTARERRIELEQGEAFFQVAKDPARPFVVRAGDQRVIAIGTQFSVRRDATGVRIVVIEGRVRVESDANASGLAPSAHVDSGNVARVGADGVLIQHKQTTELEAYLSWRTGFLEFHETPLGDAVAEFNRYSEQKIVLEDPRLAAMQIDGNFRSNNIDAFLRLLEEAFPVAVARSGSQILVRSASAATF